MSKAQTTTKMSPTATHANNANNAKDGNRLMTLPADLPVPADDGAADHLWNLRLPADLSLPSTNGGPLVVLANLKRAVIFFYPRTGLGGQPAGADWDAIPGARGCTPQACGYRDTFAQFQALGVAVLACSTQTTEYQRDLVSRMKLPYPVLSDERLELVNRLRLPTFDYAVASGGPRILIKRMAWLVEDGRIRYVWYPVFPPDENAAEVLRVLKRRYAYAATGKPNSDGSAGNAANSKL